MSSTLNRIISAIRKNTHALEITKESDLVEDLSMDSLDQVESLMRLEEEFGIEIDDDKAVLWKTVGDIENYIDSLNGKGLVH